MRGMACATLLARCCNSNGEEEGSVGLCKTFILYAQRKLSAISSNRAPETVQKERSPEGPLFFARKTIIQNKNFV